MAAVFVFCSLRLGEFMKILLCGTCANVVSEQDSLSKDKFALIEHLSH